MGRAPEEGGSSSEEEGQASGETSGSSGETDHEARLAEQAASRRAADGTPAAQAVQSKEVVPFGEDDSGDEDGYGGASADQDADEAFATIMSPTAGVDWRYWDGADRLEESRLKCFNCGKPGHKSSDCPFPRKQRPCFQCGEYGHERRACPNGICFSCMQPGHLSRDCPHRGAAAQKAREAPCARCGRRGHTVERCAWRDYDAAELTKLVCYVCGEKGHLVCQNSLTRLPEPTCHRCGAQGHTGADCRAAPRRYGGGARGATYGSPTSQQLCYRCGRAGHMARDCKGGDDLAKAAQRAAQRHGMGGGNRAGGKYPLNAGNYTGAYAAQPRHASNRYAPAFDRGTHGNYGHGNYGGVKRSREFETGGWPPRGSGQ